MGVLLALCSIPVAEGNLVVADTPVAEGKLAEVHIPVVAEGNLLADTPVGFLVVDILVAADSFVVDTLEEASAALQRRIEAAHADLHLSHVLLLVVVRVEFVPLAVVREMVLLLVVRMAVPDCP